MQLALNQLAAHLQKGVKPLYVLHGDEPLLQQEAQDAIRGAARERGYTERTSYTVSGAHFDWSAVLAAGRSLSLFADRQIIDIRIPGGKPGKDGSSALQQIGQASAGGDSVLTLVSLPRLDKATRSGAWFSALEGAGVSIAIEPIARERLPGWIAERLAAQGQRVAAGAEASTRCSSSPTASRATCSRRTRRSRSSPCCIRRASFRPNRCNRRCSTSRATTCFN